MPSWLRSGWKLCLALVVLLGLAAGLGGCSTLGFYQQAVVGQLRLLGARQDVDKLLARADLEPELRAALVDSQAVLGFAEDRLGLAADGRYGAYVELSRDYVVWNLVVTPVDSVTPRSWCFPVAGCVSYRGYFAKERAEGNARRFDADRFDTWVGGVPAYSTLGWFDDPLLSSFIHWPRPARAELLFHELAHGRLYLAGDTPFNESFATFVAAHALPLYLAAHPQGEQSVAAALAAHRERRRDRARFNGLLLRLRDQLQADFANLPLAAATNTSAIGTAATPAQQAADRLQAVRAVRALRFTEAKGCFAAVADEFTDDRFERFFARPPNLARLSLVSAYNRWVGAFAELFSEQGEDLEQFFRAAEALSKQPEALRLKELERLSQQQVETEGYNDNRDDIQCEAFTDHVTDGDLPG